MPATTAYVVKRVKLGGATDWLASQSKATFVADVASALVARYPTQAAAIAAATALRDSPDQARLGDYVRLEVVEGLFAGDVTQTVRTTLSNTGLSDRVSLAAVNDINDVLALLYTQAQKDAFKAAVDAGSISLATLRAIIAP